MDVCGLALSVALQCPRSYAGGTPLISAPRVYLPLSKGGIG